MKRVSHTVFFTAVMLFVFSALAIAQQTNVKSSTSEVKEVEEKAHLNTERLRSSGRSAESYIYRGDGESYFMVPPQQGSYGMRGRAYTSWELSRNLIENSSSREYSFEVEKEIKNLALSISGMCKEGEIRITIYMPGNKVYSEVSIDAYGSLNWKKSFELTEETKDKVGDWKFKITTIKATGNFRLSLQSN